MDTKGLQKEFINWCKSKNKLPKSEDETKQLFVAFMKEKHPEEYNKAVLNQKKQQQAQAQKALHGAKLNYFKSLKNQCAEDEEVVYYKKGGSVGCGCKKKEDGGEVVKAQPGWRANFEKRDSTKNNYPDPTEGGTKKYDPNTKKYVPVTEEDRKKWKKNLDDARKGKGEGTPERKCGGKVKKNEDGSKIKKNCNGAIAKFKMHRLGGSLNRIPFMLQGKDLPTAPKAEKRFRKNSYNTTKEGNRETTTITSQTFGYNRNWPYFRQPATILRIIEGGDTAFVETPEHHILTKVYPRTALKSGNIYVEYNPKYDKNYSLHGQANTVFNYPINSLEYETLKRRFNTAWSLK